VKRRLATHSRLVVIAMIAVAVLAAAGFAYWRATGTGSGRAVLGSPEQLVLSPGTTHDPLVPGETSSVAVVATNSNPYFVTIDSLVLDTPDGTDGFDVDAGHSGCDVSVLHFTPVPAPIGIFGQGWRVPPKVGETDGTLAFELFDSLGMDEDAANACQGATFTVHLIAGA
jgi:hypothetical protein